MSLEAKLLAEIEVLSLFNAESVSTGIKVASNAAPEIVNAIERLHAKGLVDQPDGGYLTSLGIEASDHLNHLLTILTNAEN